MSTLPSLTLLFISLILLAGTQAQIQTEKGPLLWPRPQVLEYTQNSSKSIPITRETLKYTLSLPKDSSSKDVANLVEEMMEFYKTKLFAKSKNGETNAVLFFLSRNRSAAQEYSFNIKINNVDEILPQANTNETYILNVSSDSAYLEAETYTGFIRGLETFSQLLTPVEEKETKNYYVDYTPIHIHDWPSYSHRGIMIDTARHFIPKKVLFRNIDAMMYNKMNVFHWHITDGDSFPIELRSYPEITETGAYTQSEIYSVQDVFDIVSYSLKRGVRVIPEIDAPGHTRSWALSEKLSHIAACVDAHKWTDYCISVPCGQLDPTVNETFDVVNGVLRDLLSYFPEQILHMGGDEVDYRCWDSKPEIKEWMQQNDIQGYEGLENFFRQKQKKLLNGTRRAMYWFFNSHLKVDDDDILQYWGASRNATILSHYKNNQIVLSSSDSLYLDCGAGSNQGDVSWCGDYKTWKTMYQTKLEINGVRREQILGAEACLWSELANKHIIDSKIWPRSGAIGEKLWNEEFSKEALDTLESTQSVVRRLVAMSRRLGDRGIEVAPVTSGYCARRPDICFV